jgi:hypothetical protein
MSKLEVLLNRLSKVRSRRNNTWTACCPSHEDKNPSLAVKVSEDGRILVHCFGGCSVEEVLEAVGLTFLDLYPEELIKHTDTEQARKPIKPAFFASDLLRIVHFEALVVLITAFDIDKGRMPSEDTRQRMRVAFERIDEAVRYANAG